MINGQDIIRMVTDWLSTPVSAYFGSDYGCDLESLLLKAQSAPVADAFIAKLKRDIPVLSSLSQDQLSLYASNEGHERKRIYLGIGVINLDLNAINDKRKTATGDTFNVDAG
ncbi:MAG: hypothetical protein RLY58_1954 [Pseudomonadota bacterium]|jgi:hypothetical protein